MSDPNFKRARAAVVELGEIAASGNVVLVFGTTFLADPAGRQLSKDIDALVRSAMDEKGVNALDAIAALSAYLGFMIGARVDHSQPDAGLAAEESAEFAAKIIRATVDDAFAKRKAGEL